MNGTEIQTLIKVLSRLPGLGPRSGRRLGLSLMQEKDTLLIPLLEALKEAADKVQICSKCGNLDTIDPCTLCTDPKRDPQLLCVVESVADLWALERSAAYRGQYHVLGGTLSALDGRGPDDIALSTLFARLNNAPFQEVILALSATMEGQTTAHYIMDRLETMTVKTSIIAHGIPVGGELDYLDDGTLTAALKARRLTSFSQQKV